MSTTLPNSPMVLDSTAQAILATQQSMVTQLQGIIRALGGGGGDLIMPPEYDPELEDYNKGYYVGQYVTYNDSLYKCNTTIYVSSGEPAGAFDSTKWDEITDLFTEFFQSKPGKTPSIRYTGEIYNDYIGNTADAPYAHAEGLRTIAANCAHSEGIDTQANGSYCHSEGSGSVSGGPNGYSTAAHAEGSYTKASGNNSHAEGYYTESSGSSSHAEGQNTLASSYSAHAEGYNTQATASYAHAEGYYCVASGGTSHADGYQSQATNYYAHASGYSCRATEYHSRALGYQSEATAYAAIADGVECKANKDYSHAIGYRCQTESTYETAIGRYNESYDDGSGYGWYMDSNTYEVGSIVRRYTDPYSDFNIYQCNTAIETPEAWDATHWTIIGQWHETNDTLIFSVGKGDSDNNRSNAIEVFKDGRVKINGHEAIAIDPPSTDGTYKLRCVVSSGVPTYSWVADV